MIGNKAIERGTQVQKNKSPTNKSSFPSFRRFRTPLRLKARFNRKTRRRESHGVDGVQVGSADSPALADHKRTGLLRRNLTLQGR